MTAFLAKRSWLSDEALRLDATAYASGGLAIRDRIVTRPWDWQPELPSVLTNQSNRALDLREQADAYEQRAIDEVEAWLG